jgi:hypothetical protein
LEALDRSGWAAGFAFVAHGVRVGIRTNTPEILESLMKCLPLGWRPSRAKRVDRLYSLRVGGGAERPGVRYFHLLYADAARMLRTLNLQEIFFALEYDLEVYVAERARKRVFLHAGAVGWNGRAIILPGQTRSGKTTLVAALVAAGATYYSDEFAVLDTQGRVHPYPRPLSIRTETGELRETPVEAFGGRAGRQSLPVGTVLVTRYQPGSVWRPRRLSSGKTVLQLLAHTLSVRHAPGQALAVLLQVAERARTLNGVRGDASELVGALLSEG